MPAKEEKSKKKDEGAAEKPQEAAKEEGKAKEVKEEKPSSTHPMPTREQLEALRQKLHRKFH